MCLSVYMVCSAGGMVVGASGGQPRTLRTHRRCVVWRGGVHCAGGRPGFGSGVGGAGAVWLDGLASGITGPSRDLLVKRSTPEHATGRVYGVVYSGLDIGQAVVPLFVGALMDQGAYRGVWLALVLLQGVLILSAFGVGRVRPDRPASA
jgi:FSR family fosmidomycin resistance protein-like MFS transporter